MMNFKINASWAEERTQGTKIICKSAITRSHQRESAMSGIAREGEERGAANVIALFTDVGIASSWRSRWEILRCLRAREKRRENDIADQLGDETSFIATACCIVAQTRVRMKREEKEGEEGLENFSKAFNCAASSNLNVCRKHDAGRVSLSSRSGKEQLNDDRKLIGMPNTPFLNHLLSYLWCLPVSVRKRERDREERNKERRK